jgi:hypothetical protein
MSIDFIPLDKINADALFDGRLEKLGVHEHLVKSQKNTKWLTDGDHYLEISINDDGSIRRFTGRLSCGDPINIITAIEATFDTAIESADPPAHRTASFDVRDSCQHA